MNVCRPPAAMRSPSRRSAPPPRRRTKTSSPPKAESDEGALPQPGIRLRRPRQPLLTVAGARMKQRLQKTIARSALVSGVGFLTGADITLRFHAAPPGHGIAFQRSDRLFAPPIPALVSY